MTSRILDLKELTVGRSPHLHDGQEDVPEDLAAQLFSALTAALAGVPAALLESSDHSRTHQPERSAQSILAFSFGEHARQVSHAQGQTSVTTPEGTIEHRQPFFGWLAENWTEAAEQPDEARSPAASVGPGQLETPEGPRHDLPRFALGWVGWLGYELKREAGSPDPTAGLGDPAAHPEARAAAHPWPEASLFRATHAVVLHHGPGKLELQCWDAAAEADWEEQVLAAWANLVPRHGSEEDHDHAAVLREVTVRDSRSDYLAAIRQAKREIAKGNSYEICLTTAVTGTLAPGRASGVDLFDALRTRNRAPFTAFLSIGETEILSTSPERFLSISPAGTVRSEPIKGTRPRGGTAEQDRAMIEDLRTHPKDRAENVMIADLVRNDLSIHAVPGSLRTERLCAVETYPSVHQLVSTISARIPEGVSRARVVADAFPPGSMTGAPKISTMDILQRLETGLRGPYSGVAGYFSMNGAADLAVLIRTAVLSREGESRRFHLGLGGAITADSDPAEEWEEIRTKSRGVLGALGARFPESEAAG